MEKGLLPKLKLEVTEARAKPFVPSDDTIEASIRIGKDLSAKKQVPLEIIDQFAGSIAKDMSEQGIVMNDKELLTWKQDVADGLHGKDTVDFKTPAIEAKDVDPFDFDRVKQTLDRLTKTYGQEDAKKTWDMMSTTLGTTAVIRNAQEGAYWWFWDKKSDDINDVYNNVLQQLEPTQGSISSIENIKPSSVIADVFSKKGNILPTVAKFAWPIWLPTVTHFPMQWAENIAFKKYDGQIVKLQDSVNTRVSQSLVMREFGLIRDKSPSEMMTTINRGRQATIELFDTYYTQLVPNLYDLYSAPVKVIGRSYVEAALSAIKMLVLPKKAKAYAKEMLATRKKEQDAWDKVNANLLATIGSLESIKTSDSMEKAAKVLKEGVVARDFIRSGGMDTLEMPEGKEDKVLKVLDWAFPGAEQIWKGFEDWNEYKLKRQHILKYIRENGITKDSFSQPGDVINVLSGAFKTDVSKVLNVFDAKEEEKEVLGKLGYNKDPAMFGILQFATRAYGLVNAASQMKEMEQKYLGLASLYVTKILPLMQDIEKMEELLGPYDALDKPDGAREKARMPVSSVKSFDIKAENLQFGKILNNVSLEIPQGSFVTIKGTSGLGKTTFMRHLLGLYEGDGGQVTYGGVKVGDIKKFGAESVYSKIGYAPQHTEFFENQTLRENLVTWTQRQVPEEEIQRVLKDLNLGHIIDRLDSKEKHYSGGELRRMGIAQALLKNPSILYLDEPTANLDAISSGQVMQTISELRKKRPDLTVIAITHDPAFEKIAEKVIDFGTINKREMKIAPVLNDHQVLEAIARPTIK